MRALTAEHHFSCPIYSIDTSQFLNTVSGVSEEYLARVKSQNILDEIYPVYMSESYHEDHRLAEFSQFIIDAGFSALGSQGYNTDLFDLRISAMWTQEHHKHSAMEQHVHPNCSMVGFYFLETSENCSRAVFHDPRSMKIMAELPERDTSVASSASQMINYAPRPGLMILTNAWIAHSFTRHRPEQPIKFVHFNLYPQFKAQCASQPRVEVV